MIFDPFLVLLNVPTLVVHGCIERETSFWLTFVHAGVDLDALMFLSTLCGMTASKRISATQVVYP